MSLSRSLYFFLLLFLNSTSLFSQKTFKDYCKTYKTEGSNFEIDHTVKVLFEITGKASCEEAFDILKKLEYLDLSAQKLSDLAPLSGLTNLKTLDISYNKLEDLWGLENLIGLERLIANNNQISNITPLASLKKLTIVNLNDNKIEYFSALKELCYLETYLFEGNPVFGNEPERLFLNGLMYMRGKYKEGIPYEFNPKGPVEDLEECLLYAAERGDFIFYRSLLSNPVVSERLLDRNFLDNTTSKVKKIVLAVRFSKDISYALIEHYKKINGISLSTYREDFYKFLLLVQRRKQLESFFEFYLAEGDFFPYNYDELKGLEKNLKRRIKVESHASSLHPRYIQKIIKSWELSIFESGIVPGKIATGFTSM